MELPEGFLTRMQSQLGGGHAAYLRAMEAPPARALWVNSLKIAPEGFLALADFPLTPVEEAPGCLAFPKAVAIGRHPLHLAGLCYVQEPSAQRPVALLGVEPGMTVLDLCAAPGGKAGQIAKLLKGQGLLVANEISHARAAALVSNLERLGVQNALTASLHPLALCRALSGRCHRVLVDAPCSGEGMFRKEAGAAADWSPAQVRACAARQREILDAAALAVRPGGRLVYSTCTFSPEENQEQARAFASRHPGFVLTAMEQLYPHTFPGEGQFMAVFSNEAGETGKGAAKGPTQNPWPSRDERRGKAAETGDLAPWEEFCRAYLTRRPAGEPWRLPDGRVVLRPAAYDGALAGLRVRRAGTLAGEIKKGRFLPAHGLFLSLGEGDTVQRLDLEGAALSAFLAGEAVPCGKGLSGWCAVGWKGYNLGFGKAVKGVLKNHLPKGLRLA